MGFFTDQEKDGLRITQMTLHVVGGEGDFVPENVRPIEHEEFFIARILDTDVDAIYSFRETSSTKNRLQRIAAGIDTFEGGAQELSASFSRAHRNNSRDGALFIFELSVFDPQVKIYSLIKYDYSEAIEQAPLEEGGLLRRIVHAFVADKKAIQKCALVRVANGVAEDLVSARDRMKKAPEIVDYFADFLDVNRTMSDKELNEKLLGIVRDVLQSNSDDLTTSAPEAFSVARQALAQRNEIDEHAIIEAVLLAAGRPDDERIITRLQNATRRKIRSARIENLVFPSDPDILGRPPTRKIRTTEGVTVLYPDHAEATVGREVRADGGEIITVITNAIVEDKIVS